MNKIRHKNSRLEMCAHPVLREISEDELVSFIREMVRVPSVSGQEKELANFLADHMKKMGFDSVQVYDVVKNRPNVIGKIEGTGDGPALVFNGHLDTVDISDDWTFDPFGGTIKDGKLYGHGIMDMKAGLGCQIIAASAVKRAKLNRGGDIFVTGVMDHMQYQLGARDVAKKIHGDGCIVGEPTNLDLVIAHRGRVFVDITTLGKSAHTAEKETVINALEKMAKIVLKLQDVKFKATVPDEVKKLLGDEMYFSVNSIKAGLPFETAHKIPDLCVVRVDCRPAWGITADDIVKEIQKSIDDVRASDPQVKARLEIIKDLCLDSFYVNPEEAIVLTLKDSIQRIQRREPKIEGRNWVGDSSVFYKVMPTVVCGPGGPPYYMADECLDIKTLVDTAKIYALAAVNFCKRE